MIKNKLYRLKVLSLGAKGEGVAKNGKYVCFIPYALAGEEVEALALKVKGNVVYMKLINVLTPSPARREPDCDIYNKCGGCTLLHLDYRSQSEAKRDFVYETVKRIGKIDFPADDIIPSPQTFNYRNKALIPVCRDKNGRISAGFFRGSSHDILNAEECRIQNAEAFKIARTVKEWAEKYDIAPYSEKEHTGILRHIYVRTAAFTGEIMAGVVANSLSLPFADELVSVLLENHPGIVSVIHNINTEKTNVILGEKTNILYGRPYIEDSISGKRFKIGVLSFYQVNPYNTGNLYSAALEGLRLDRNDILFDIYCGIGTIGLCAADKVKKVIGIEINKEAVSYARENAALNGIDNAEFYYGKAEEKIFELKNSAEKPTAVVLDPPRAGCQRPLLDALNELAPEKIAYISCHPATLARDLDILVNEFNYKLNKLIPVDMFPHTNHVETVVLMSRK